MKDATPSTEIKENNDNIILTQSMKLFHKTNINSLNNSTEYTQDKIKNEPNSNQNNIFANTFNKDEDGSKISLNKDELYETFLMFHNYLSTKQQQNQIKKNITKNSDISDFNLGNEEENKNISISNIQRYNQSNLKKSYKKNLEDLQSLNNSKIKRNKYMNECFNFNKKNINNINKEYSYDFSSNNNLDSYSTFKGNSLLIRKKNKNKLNIANINNKTTTESKKIKGNNNINKTTNGFEKKEVIDYKNKSKEKELIYRD